MGVIVAVEGLDGAGKATLVGALADAARARGAAVATWAFPRYERSVHAALAGEALRGELGDTADSVHGMALLFALDRRDAAEGLRADAATHDLVLVDRYVASNAAYGAARLHQSAGGPFAAWVHGVEIGRFGLPAPAVQVLVRVPGELAARRVVDRAAADPARVRDGYESDAGLQARCAAVYDELVASDWLAPWWVADTEGDRLSRSADDLARHLLGSASDAGSSVSSDTIET